MHYCQLQGFDEKLDSSNSNSGTGRNIIFRSLIKFIASELTFYWFDEQSCTIINCLRGERVLSCLRSTHIHLCAPSLHRDSKFSCKFSCEASQAIPISTQFQLVLEAFEIKVPIIFSVICSRVCFSVVYVKADRTFLHENSGVM